MLRRSQDPNRRRPAITSNQSFVRETTNAIAAITNEPAVPSAAHLAHLADSRAWDSVRKATVADSSEAYADLRPATVAPSAACADFSAAATALSPVRADDSAASADRCALFADASVASAVRRANSTLSFPILISSSRRFASAASRSTLSNPRTARSTVSSCTVILRLKRSLTPSLISSSIESIPYVFACASAFSRVQVITAPSIERDCIVAVRERAC